MVEEFEGNAVIGGEGADGVAEREEGSDSDDIRAEGLQVGEGAENRGAGVDDVIHDGDAFAANERAKWIGEVIFDRVESLTGGIREALGVDEIAAHFERDYQGDERAFDERAADNFDTVWGEAGSELRGAWLKRARVEAKFFELKPEIAVVAGLEKEMALASVE